jgi:gluconokinase
LNDFNPPYILALDIGTSGIRASLFDCRADEIPELKIKAPTPFAADGSVEPDAEELLQTVFGVLDGISTAADQHGIRPSCVSISCFWHSLVGIASDGRPVTPLLTWADTRAETFVSSLQGLLRESSVHDRTGCHFHSSYWPAKLLRIKAEDSAAFVKAESWLSFSDLILQRITGETITGISMASGTGIFNIRGNFWDDEMCGAVGIDIGKLPRVASPDEEIFCDEVHATRWPALKDARWLPPVGDGAANNFGAGCVGRGKAALMIGTSGAMRMVYESDVPESIPQGLFCYRLDETRICIGGAISDGGSLRAWLAQSLGLEIGEEEIAARIRDRGADSHGLAFLPFVFGERSTGYHQGASGAVIGLTRGSDALDFVIAGLEAVAYRFAEILERLEAVCPVDEITASGGALEGSPVWQQIIADVLGRDIRVFPSGGVSRRGAGILGLWSQGVSGAVSEVQAAAALRVLPDGSRHLEYGQGFERHKRFYTRMFD